MPTETEVIQQLQQYGAWLEAEVGTELANIAGSAVPVDFELEGAGPLADPNGSNSPASGISWGVRALLAVSAVTVLAGFAWLTRQPDSTVADVPAPQVNETDTTLPPAEQVETLEPLFVLPSPLEDFQPVVIDSSEEIGRAIDTSGSRIFVGRATPTGFSDVSSISLVDELSFAGAQTDVAVGDRMVQIPTDLASGPNAAFSVAVDGGRFLEFAPASADLRAALLEAVAVVDGELVFTPVDGLDVLSRIDRLEDVEIRYTLNRLRPLSQNMISIAVRSHPTQAEALRFTIGDLELVEVRGHEGLLISRTGDGESSGNALVWVEEPGQTISVSAPSSYDIIEIAEGLRIVDEQTWNTALEESAAAPGD